jgi:glycosyltransferase involved in cell wall biosynthesis
LNQRKIRVAIIHNIISPYRVALFEQLAREEELDLYIYYSAGTHKERRWKVNPGQGYGFEILRGRPLEIGPIVFNWSPSVLFKLLRNEHEVIIIGGMSDLTSQLALMAAKIKGRPCLIWSEGIESSTSFLGKIVGPLVRILIRKSDGVIVSGSASLKFHQDMGIPVERLTVAVDAVDNDRILKMAEKYPDREVLKDLLGFKGRKIVLFVGQMIQRKGPDHLLRAFISLHERIPEATLVMVGDGPMKSELERMCQVQNIQDVIFTGWLQDDEKIAQYKTADLFVLPTHEDVWGLVINEAMVMGLPILTTTKAGAYLDLVRECNGRVISDANEQDLFNAMHAMLKDNKSLKGMGDRSREIIMGEFRIEQEAKGFLDAIHKVMD